MGITCRPGQQLGFPRFCVHGYHHDVGPLRLGWLLGGPSASGKCVPTQRGARTIGPKEGSNARTTSTPPEIPTYLPALGSKPGLAAGTGLQWGWRSLERSGKCSSFSLLHFEFYRISLIYSVVFVLQYRYRQGIHQYIYKCQVLGTTVPIQVIRAFRLAFCWWLILIAMGISGLLPPPKSVVFFFSFLHFFPLVSLFKLLHVSLPLM